MVVPVCPRMLAFFIFIVKTKHHSFHVPTARHCSVPVPCSLISSSPESMFLARFTTFTSMTIRLHNNHQRISCRQNYDKKLPTKTPSTIFDRYTPPLSSPSHLSPNNDSRTSSSDYLLPPSNPPSKPVAVLYLKSPSPLDKLSDGCLLINKRKRSNPRCELTASRMRMP